MFELDYVQTVGVKSFVMARRAKFIPEGFYTLKSLPIGEFFKRTERAKKVYIRGSYNGKTYDVQDYNDMNRYYSLKGTTKVYAGFTY